MNDLYPLETHLLDVSERLALAERKLFQEFLLRVASGINTFQAQKMAEIDCLADVRRTQAEYEIALARMKRG